MARSVIRTRAGKVLSLAMAASLLLSACTTTSGPADYGSASPSVPVVGGAPMTPDEAQMRDEADTFNTTVVEGSLLGAGLGILAGVLIGATTGRVDNMVKYGVMGGVAGGVMGGVDGYMVAKQQETGNNKVRTIQAMTHDVQQDNIKLQALVDSSNRVLADSEQRLAAINEQVEQKTADLTAARAEKGRIEQNRDVMKASLDTLKKRRDVYQKAAARTTGDTRQLDQEIQRLNQQITELEKNVVAMNAALSVSKV